MSDLIIGIVRNPVTGRIWHRAEFTDKTTAQNWAAEAPKFRHITQEQETTK